MEVRRIPIASIKVKDRARQDMGDIPELAASIQEKGLIQPITVNEKMQLLAGERRLLAHKHLGLNTIEAVIRNGTDSLDALEIELTENFFRKEMAWNELCELQKRIFEEKSKKQKWNQTKQAEMLHSSQPQVSRQIKMAEALELLPELSEKATFDEAWKELKSLEEDIRKQAAKQPQKSESKKENTLEEAWRAYSRDKNWLEEMHEKEAFIAGYMAGKKNENN